MSRAGSPAAVVEAWRPYSFSAEVAAFAKEVVAAASPPSAPRAKAWLFATGRIAAFAWALGMALEAEVVLGEAMIERFAAQGCGDLCAATRRTLRTNLRSLSRALESKPALARLPREAAKNPYSEAEIAGLLALADTQPTTARAMRASGLICLGAGAGLVGAELSAVKGTDVVARFGGVLVEVSGPRARSVPVLGAYHDRLTKAAAFAGQGFILGGSAASRRNVASGLVGSLAGGGGLPRLETARLRATWLAQVAERIGLRAFMDAAGIVCSQRLGDIVASLPSPGDAAAVAILGASS